MKKARENFLKNLEVHEKLFNWAKENLHLGTQLPKLIEERLRSVYKPYADYLKLDLEINAQGIAFVANKHKT